MRLLLIERITRLHIQIGAIAGLLTLGLVATIVPDVIARSFFQVAIYGMSETSVMLLIFMVFLGLPGAQATKEHFRITILDELLGATAQRLLAIIRYAICVVTGFILTHYAILGAYDSTLRNEKTYAVIPFPVWPARIAIAVGLVLLTLQFLLDLIRAIRGSEIEKDHHAM